MAHRLKKFWSTGRDLNPRKLRLQRRTLDRSDTGAWIGRDGRNRTGLGHLMRVAHCHNATSRYFWYLV